MRLKQRLGISFGAFALAGLVWASTAPAAHHLVRIQEVFPGQATNTDAEFVELQLSAANENQLFSTTTVRLYNAVGTLMNSVTFSGNPANGENNRSVLVGTATSAVLFPGMANDLTLPTVNALAPAGGAACFESTTFVVPTGPGIDCVSWGNLTPGGTFPINTGAGTGTPEAAIPDTKSLVRSIAPGCPTLLETSDDTNDSATDFSPATPAPRNNATTPSETACLTPPPVTTPPGNPASPINPAGNVRKRKCKKKASASAVSAKKKCKKKKK